MKTEVESITEWGIQWPSGYVDGPLATRSEALEYASDDDVIVSRQVTEWETS